MGRLRIRPSTLITAMTLTDIHTHNNHADNSSAILNCNGYIGDRCISLGIHPWDTDDSWREKFGTIATAAGRENVVAIGECGIDRLKAQTNIQTQIEVLRSHAILAEECRKPLILHCVKGVDEILALRKELKPQQAWIIHGFRGKPQQAEQITAAGIYVSFGEHFNARSVTAVSAERLFVESDESRRPLEEIYRAIAGARGCTVEELARQTAANVALAFHGRI